MRTQAQIIKNKGKPEWAVIPYKDYLRFQELEAVSNDIAVFKKKLSSGEEELIPDEYAKRLIKGENPIRIWREYRELTQVTLADAAGISAPYLSQLEHGERTASIAVLKDIADVLRVSLDDLV